MLADQRYDANSKDEASGLYPSKRKTGVLQKTRQALGKVNSKIKSSTKPASVGQMMLFESDSSFSFNLDDADDDDAVKPFSEMNLKTQDKEEEDNGTRATEVESCSDHKDTDTKEMNGKEDEEAKVHFDTRTNSLPSPRRHESLVSPRRNLSTRHASRSSRGRKSEKPPQKASSCGDIHLHSSRSSKRPSSARLKRHTSGTSQSPGALATPTQLSKESVGLPDLPETPLTAATDILHETPEMAENSSKRVHHQFEEDNGIVGGYFSKLVEKMEGDDAEDRTNEKELEALEDAKKGSKFKTPKGIKKLFSLNRDKTPRQSSTSTPKPAEGNTQVNDLAMFTAFISSPKPLDSPQRSERKQRSVTASTEDDFEPDMDFPEIPSEKQTRLDDIRKDVCWKREKPVVGSTTRKVKKEMSNEPSSPGSLRNRKEPSSPGSLRNRKEPSSPGSLRNRKDPSSPGSFRNRRSKSSDADNHANPPSGEGIPRHSMSTRRTRAIRTSESSSNDKEQQEDKLLSRSTHRSRRSRGSTSRATSDHASSRKSTDSAERNDNRIEERKVQDDVETADEKIEKRPSDFRLSRSSRGSSRRLVSNIATENSRRKRASGTRRLDRAASDHAQTNTNKEKEESGGRQPHQLGRSTSLSHLYGKTEKPRRGKKSQSLCVGSEHGVNQLFSVNELDSSDAEEMPFDNEGESEVFTAELSSIQESLTDKHGGSKRAPSLAESLERGSDLNRRLFDDDGQETVVTDDGSCWLDQGSVSGLNIRSSASVAAPQLSFDQHMTKVVDDR